MLQRKTNVPVFKIKQDELDYRLSYFNKDKLFIYKLLGYGNISVYKGHINVYSMSSKNTKSYIIDETWCLTLNQFMCMVGIK